VDAVASNLEHVPLRFREFYQSSALRQHLSFWRAGQAIGNKRAETSRSLPSLLKLVYPENFWRFWSFPNPAASLWADDRTVGRFLVWFGQERELESEEQWSRVSFQQFADVGARGLYPRLPELIRSLFPSKELSAAQ